MTIFVTAASVNGSSHGSLMPSFTLRLHYNSLLFSQPRIALLFDQLQHLLSEVAAHPLSPVGPISLLTPQQRAILPDPRADLDFCGWKGAITDIFSANAARHPDRRCIVESKPDRAAAPRVFTYAQIDKASNVLAHHLVASGIEREDVVTVYSTRGVDLVVAVMGVLKAGATFSVIGQSRQREPTDLADPAYPPARQQIYLRVAQPRALVILAAAGKLLPPVREFVQSNLQIKCEVPALQLQDDGSLHGGLDAKGSDVLLSSPDKASLPVGIPIGPDSVGTLSFTSGSTGIPKGVRGRHFSLTHFFPWMGERFGMSEKERFTMLSGIAHDPIQRDSA